MTIGKVTKKETRVITKKYNFMKKKTNNLTLKDFAELIEFMNEADERTENGAQQSGRQAPRPVLGVGHYVNPHTRLNNQTPSAARQRTAVTYKRNELPTPAVAEKKKENDADRNPLESPESRRMSEVF